MGILKQGRQLTCTSPQRSRKTLRMSHWPERSEDWGEQWEIRLEREAHSGRYIRGHPKDFGLLAELMCSWCWKSSLEHSDQMP